MSSLAALSRRFSRLQEISSVMAAMKNLALVETKKLARFIEQQRQMVANIAAATADFLQFYPLPAAGAAPPCLLLIGSERGFCGNFNERVLDALAASPLWAQRPSLVVVGQRLATRLQSRLGLAPDDFVSLAGATVSEEVPNVLVGLMDALLPTGRHSTRLNILALAPGMDGTVTLHYLLPLQPDAGVAYPQPPAILLPPTQLFAELLDHYLLASLHGLLYQSLVAENRQRLAHMEQALDRLDETVVALALKRNALRQEQIVEEIEIMLSGRLAFGRAP